MTSDDVTPASPVGSRASSAISWIVLDKWGTRLISLAVLTVLGRLLPPTDFGLIALASVVIAFGSTLSDQGFSKALVQRLTLTQEYVSTAFWTALASSAVIAGAVIALAGPLSSLLGDESLAPVLMALSATFVLSAATGAPIAVMEREFRFKQLAGRQFLGAFLGGGAGISAALLGAGVWSLVVQTLVASVTAVAVLWWRSGWRPTFLFSFRALRDMWSVGMNILGIELIGLLNAQADRLIVGAFLGAEALGYYFLAMRIVSIIVDLFSSIFADLALTTFSRLQDQRDQMLRWLYRLAGLSTAVALPIFTTAALAAPQLLPLVWGQQWTPSVPLFQILCWLGALNALAYYDRSALVATGNARVALALTVGQALLGVGLELLAAPFGVVFIAVAVVARQYLYWPIRLIVLRRYIGIRVTTYWLTWFRIFAVAVAVAVLVFAAQQFLMRYTENDWAVLGLTISLSAGLFAVGIRLVTPRLASETSQYLKTRLGRRGPNVVAE